MLGNQRRIGCIMQIDKPLVVFDLETTGLDNKYDRVVQMAFVRLDPGEEPKTWKYLINPEMHIPEEVSEIHGITDEDVKDAPKFREVADEVLDIFEGACISGFNSASFDVPFILQEFKRCASHRGKDIRKIAEAEQIDVQHLYRDYNPRTLVAAVMEYTGINLEDAHDALADTEATMKLLGALIERHELPDTVTELAELSKGDYIDAPRKLKRDADGDAVFGFGKHKGKKLRKVVAEDNNYMRWFLRKSDFPYSTRKAAQEELEGM